RGGRGRGGRGARGLHYRRQRRRGLERRRGGLRRGGGAPGLLCRGLSRRGLHRGSIDRGSVGRRRSLRRRGGRGLLATRVDGSTQLLVLLRPLGEVPRGDPWEPPPAQLRDHLGWELHDGDPVGIEIVAELVRFESSVSLPLVGRALAPPPGLGGPQGGGHPERRALRGRRGSLGCVLRLPTHRNSLPAPARADRRACIEGRKYRDLRRRTPDQKRWASPWPPRWRSEERRVGKEGRRR